MPPQPSSRAAQLDEATHALLPPRGDHEILGCRLLQHPPLHLHVVAGVTPVAPGIEVAQEQARLQTSSDARHAAGDLAGHEGFTAARTFVVEQDAVAGIHPVGLAVIHRDPVGIELGHAIGAAGMKRGGLPLGCFLHQSIQLTGAGLVDACGAGEAQHPHRFEDAQGAEAITVGRVFRRFETHRHVALGPEVVDLIGPHLPDDPDQVAAVGEIAVMEGESGIPLMGILVEVIDAGRVEAAGPTLEAMHPVALLQQQLSQI